MSKARRWIYHFGDEIDKGLLGGKGANLGIMTRLGLPVPTGFTVSTEACIAYQGGKAWPHGLEQQLTMGLETMERLSGKKFGDPDNPLLVSVRSGAAVSMPGMMDTVLCLPMNDEIAESMAARSDPRFAYDCFRRFIQMFSDVVCHVPRKKFEQVIDRLKERKGVQNDTDLNAEDLKDLIPEFKRIFVAETGKQFPVDPQQQLRAAVSAVFDSWNNPRAQVYRNLHRIPHTLGTAVTIQEMVFGNMGFDCATGVAFTRDPSTGENRKFGEYLCNAQGEDVVAGIRTPNQLQDMQKDFPEAYDKLFRIFDHLEKHFSDMQDVEFTIERKRLFLLQTRSGKRTAAAAVRIAVEMVAQGLLTQEQAILRVKPEQLEHMLHPQFSSAALAAAGQGFTRGLAASPGAAVGQAVFHSERAVQWVAEGKTVILVRMETSPEDIAGMASAVGILTARGGASSHAAVVARGMNKPAVAGASECSVNEDSGELVCRVSGEVIREGDWLSLNGGTGLVYRGKLEVEPASVSENLELFLGWADKFRKLEVLANADTPQDAEAALKFGAQGIGLTRTEHMFFAPGRIQVVREMILANSDAARRRALARLLPVQREDFQGILGVMDGKPVVIRLLDPPLHEFMPREDQDIAELARITGRSLESVKRTVHSMAEVNPMLGFRGVRLGLVHPEINEMQIQAIFEAALALKRQGKRPLPFIEVPLVGKLAEYLHIKDLVERVAKDTGAKDHVEYQVGTMIEVPRAALTAEEFAPHCDFMSFGTNDLTQMTCGFSRDDAGAFLNHYVEKGIYKADPFQTIDGDGVGKLMRVCVQLSRAVKPGIDIGICGEHGGDPKSIELCHQYGLNNVSCSPFRVPVARLAAAQAAIKFGQQQNLGPVFTSRL